MLKSLFNPTLKKIFFVCQIVKCFATVKKTIITIQCSCNMKIFSEALNRYWLLINTMLEIFDGLDTIIFNTAQKF